MHKMPFLNYHHLRYFHAIAKEGSVTGAAKRLNLSQSALSVQLRRLEEDVGHPLFDREHKSLKLTEAGRLAYDYAESIFRTGDELEDLLRRHAEGKRRQLSVGVVATLSRNFQAQLLAPMIRRTDVGLTVRSGSFRELLSMLEDHSLDVVLSTMPARREGEHRWRSHLLSQEPVSLVARKAGRMRPFRFPDDLRGTPLILPSQECSIRPAFDHLLERRRIEPVIAAEIDDMAMLRLMARESGLLTLVPAVVVKDELVSGEVVERHRFSGIKESFYAVTISRRFPNDLVAMLLESADRAASPAAKKPPRSQGSGKKGAEG
jgi:LysR family transcriptional activator of nhaA